jgi:PAS domain S-box-containing protein
MMFHKFKSGNTCQSKPLCLETLKFFIPSLLLLAIALGIHYVVIVHEQNLLIAQEESLKVEQTRKKLEQKILRMQADTLRFAELVGHQTEKMTTNIDALARQFSHIMAFKPQYMQVRFLSSNGAEKVRLERTINGVSRQLNDLLQDKSHRRYFQEGIVLQPGTVYLSPLDLNVEWHSPQPEKLTMRMATPVLADNGEKVGLLVINYDGVALLKELLSVFEDTQKPSTPFGTFRLVINNFTVEFTRSDDQKIQFTLLESGQDSLDTKFSSNRRKGPDGGQVWQPEERLTTYSSLSPLDGIANSTWWVSHSIVTGRIYKTSSAFFGSLPLYIALLIILGVGSRLQAGHRLAVRQVQDEHLHQLTRIVELSPSAIMLTDSDARIFYTNTAFTQRTGYQSSEVKGYTPRFLQSSTTNQEQYGKLWDTLKQGKPWHGEFHNRRKDGSLFWEAALIFPIRHPWSRQTCYVAIKQDISNEKALQEKLKQETLFRFHQEQLAKIGRMANMIAHDLRNPLTSIKISLQMAQRRAQNSVDQPSRHDTLWGLALNQVEYMERILDDILNYSSQGQLHVQNLDTNMLLSRIIDEMQGPLRKAKVSVNWSLAPQLPIMIADPARLRQVFQNLLDNALQATESARGERFIGIETRFGLENESPYLMVTITNNGKQMDGHTKNHAFKHFFTTRAKGTGLGLAIVKKHVDRHGGQVTIDSLNGIVQVCVVLPLCPTSEIPTESSDRNGNALMYAVNEEL